MYHTTDLVEVVVVVEVEVEVVVVAVVVVEVPLTSIYHGGNWGGEQNMLYTLHSTVEWRALYKWS